MHNAGVTNISPLLPMFRRCNQCFTVSYHRIFPNNITRIGRLNSVALLADGDLIV